MQRIREELYPRLIKSISQIDKIRLILGITALAGTLGGIIYGLLLARVAERPAMPMNWVEDISYTIPLLTIEGYTDKELVLKTDGLGMRIAMEDQILSAPPETSFRVALDERLRAALPESGTGTLATVGEACPFVAGTTGKYVYPAEDSRAKRLKTRRCFASEQEAVAAGLAVPEK